jgi:hypothetical protein
LLVRTRDFVPLALLAGVAAFIIVQGREMGRVRRAERLNAPAKGATTAAAESVLSQGTNTSGQTRPASPNPASAPNLAIEGSVELSPSDEPAPKRDNAAIRAQIQENEGGTYMFDILQQQNQLLMRWPDRRANPLRVWIERDVNLSDWNAQYPVVAEHAFDEWRAAGFPVQFDVVPSRVATDIQIRWISQFPESDGWRIGATNKTRDQNGWLVTAEIVIALHDRQGRPLSPEIIAGIARHEVGHALGLGHSSNTADVMFPQSTTPTISDADRATLHLMYMLPPGIVK